MSSRRSRTSRPLGGYHLSEALIAGWRPLARLDVDGFALLRSRGVTRRANSAVAVDAPSSTAALTSAIERIEMLCETAGEAATFRVLDVHGPPGLDDLLAARGYGTAGPSELLELDLTAASRLEPSPSAVICTGALDQEWFDAFWRLAPREGDQARETLHAIMAGTPAVQVLLPDGADGADGAGGADGADGSEGSAAGRPAAVGRAALVEAGREQAAVLNAIAVDPGRRRRGLGRAVSQTLLSIAAVQGASRALLEVETDNPGALALYRTLGFRRLGGYHYRVRPPG
ncbi:MULTISPECIES: GNAT family N-acetyltransferase [unclassified Brachybacterium]|uniref:GNAT family N-acetyltransferase n=1 Tax=unclassified Brachybacterium TaxID=2623841 RepID=UPI00360E2F88